MVTLISVVTFITSHNQIRRQGKMFLILCCPNLGATTETDDQAYISARTLAECKRSVALGRNIIIKRDIVKKRGSGGGSFISDASSVDETSIETS